MGSGGPLALVACPGSAASQAVLPSPQLPTPPTPESILLCLPVGALIGWRAGGLAAVLADSSDKQSARLARSSANLAEARHGVVSAPPAARRQPSVLVSRSLPPSFQLGRLYQLASHHARALHIPHDLRRPVYRRLRKRSGGTLFPRLPVQIAVPLRSVGSLAAVSAHCNRGPRVCPSSP